MADRRPSPGRPPLSDGEETERVTLRTTASEYDALATLAELRGWLRAGRPVVSMAARSLIREGLMARGLLRDA